MRRYLLVVPLLVILIFLAILFFSSNVLGAGKILNIPSDDSAFIANIGVVKQFTKDIIALDQDIQALAKSKSLTAQGESVVKINKLKTLAKIRKQALLELAKQNAKAFLLVAISSKERVVIPSFILGDIEQEVILQAKTEVIHVDDFQKPENSRFDYFLKKGTQRLNFYPTQQLLFTSDTTLQVKGFQLDNTVVADVGDSNIQVVAEAPVPESIGDQKTLIFLVDFLDTDPSQRPWTREEAYNAAFNGQFQNFMKEQSYNQVSFSGDVYGWITLPKNSSGLWTCGSVYLSDLEKYISQQNIQLSNYGRIVYLTHPSLGAGGCSSVGKSETTVNGAVYRLSQAWVGLAGANEPSWWGQHPFSWTSFDYVMSHEIGHSLGVMHANGWDCQDQILYGDCQHREYGNYFDTMGNGNLSLHFNAFYKELLGWINPSQSLLIDKDGSYTLNSLEAGSGTLLAKIQMLNSTTTPFALEYRQGTGFDAKLNDSDLVSNQTGLFVNNIIKSQWQFPFPRLLDMQPTFQGWWDDAKQVVINTNQKFEDAGNGITIGPVRNATDDSITFDVDLNDPICVRSQPSIQSVGYPFNIAVGGNLGLSIIFFNSDTQSCGPSEFQFIPILPAGFTVNYSYATSTVAPQDSGWLLMVFSPPTILGTYSISYDLINKNNGLKISGNISINVVAPPVISSINPSKGPAGSNVQINGSGFSLSNDNSINFWINGINFYFGFISSSDGNTLIFQIPSSMYTFACDCYASTTLGVYQMKVWANGVVSNTVNFDVTSPSITVLSPNGGEQAIKGQTYPIKWAAPDLTNIAGYQNLKWRVSWRRSTGDAGTITSFPVTATTSFTYNVKIPLSFATGSDYKVRVSLIKNCVNTAYFCPNPSSVLSPTFDESDASFSIVDPTITLLSPNGGEKWQLGDTHTILWTPYDPLNNVNPASSITAYLRKKLSDGSFVTVGKITECGKASIHWDGSLDDGNCGSSSYPAPGNYYVRVVNKITGVADRSDKPFTLVAPGTIKADLKINDSDGPIIVPPEGGVFTASWSSNAEVCNIYNFTANYDNPDYQFSNLPPSGSRQINLYPNYGWYDKSIVLTCSSKIPIEGSAHDSVVVSSIASSSVAVLWPNGGESFNLSNSYAISWRNSSDIYKVSIALYKNDASFVWIATDLPTGIGGTGLYNWMPSDTISNADIGDNIFKIYILGFKTLGGAVEDKSDAPFSIVTSGGGGGGGGATLSFSQMANVLEAAKSTLTGILNYLQSR